MVEKCQECNKNIKLLSFECKCHKKFCIKCLQKHNCEFDYKKEQKELLEKTLIKSNTKNYISI